MIFTKKSLLGFLCFLGFAGVVQGQTFTLDIDAGYLKNAAGTTPEPLNGLLQLVASPSGTFSAPSSTSYVTGDNVLVASFAMNYGGSTSGETTNNLIGLPFSNTGSTYVATQNYTLGAYTLTTGEDVQLRFYPNATYSTSTNYNTSSLVDTTFGAVRSDTIEFGASGGDPTETPWVVPAAGGGPDLEYITVGDGGTYADATAFASNPVTPVPEPSTYGIVGGALMSLLSFQSWTRRRAT